MFHVFKVSKYPKGKFYICYWNEGYRYMEVKFSKFDEYGTEVGLLQNQNRIIHILSKSNTTILCNKQ